VSRRASNVRKIGLCYHGESGVKVSEQHSKFGITASFRSMFMALAGLWVIELIDTFLLGSRLQRYGIHPWSLQGLWGVLTAPLLHGGWSHLIANSMPFVVLGGLVRTRGEGRFWSVSLLIILVGGAGTWLFGGTGTNHIGASGLIFGWFGYLLLAGWYERSLSTAAISIVVGGLYGGMIWGVLPIRAGVSWQGHLFGFIGGWLAAKWSVRQQSDDGA